MPGGLEAIVTKRLAQAKFLVIFGTVFFTDCGFGATGALEPMKLCECHRKVDWATRRRLPHMAYLEVTLRRTGIDRNAWPVATSGVLAGRIQSLGETCQRRRRSCAFAIIFRVYRRQRRATCRLVD